MWYISCWNVKMRTKLCITNRGQTVYLILPYCVTGQHSRFVSTGELFHATPPTLHSTHQLIRPLCTPLYRVTLQTLTIYQIANYYNYYHTNYLWIEIYKANACVCVQTFATHTSTCSCLYLRFGSPWCIIQMDFAQSLISRLQ